MKKIVDLNKTLDPQDWSSMRKLGHEMIDDVMNYLENIGAEPVWRPIPSEVKATYNQPIPMLPSEINKVYDEFKTSIFPYTKGNIHPRFFAWVQGTGTPMGVLAELLSAAMNPNVTIGEHAAMYIDNQVIQWCKQMMNFPDCSSGILLSGASMANITALTVARNSQLKKDIRKNGVLAVSGKMTLYCSTETHSCVQKAAEVLGLGADAVRRINVNHDYQIDLEELTKTIEADILAGCNPFCIVANAGTVNTAAIDPLAELQEISKRYNLWFHIDGAFGALAKMSPSYAVRLKAIEQADSVAFDLHKWMYMSYEIACVLIKDSTAHRASFATNPDYLIRETRGLAAGPDLMNNYGLELSRGFKALKVWMSIKEHGLERYVQMIQKNIDQAVYLEELINNSSDLELLAKVSLNIVCYRFIKDGLSLVKLNELNKEIILQLQEQGIASPSSTILNDHYVIRVCIVNQRTKQSDIDLLITET